MPILVTFLALGAPPVELAYVARYDAPSTSKVKSKFRVYLGDLRGTTKRPVELPGTPLRVTWRDRNTLLIEREKQGALQFDLATLKLSPGTWPENPAYPDIASRGIRLSGWFAKPSFDGTRLVLKSFEGEVKFIPLPKNWNQNELGGLTRLWGLQPHRWFYAGLQRSNSTHGPISHVLRFETATGKVTTIIRDANSYDFDPRRRYWCAVEARTTTPVDRKRSVWTGALIAGDLISGERWQVTKGLCWAVSAAIRPASLASGTRAREATPRKEAIKHQRLLAPAEPAPADATEHPDS